MRYRIIRVSVVTVALLAQLASAQQKVSDKDAPDAVRLRAHVTHLASERLEGRKTGTPGAEAAARYVAEEFKRAGLLPGNVRAHKGEVEAGDYLQPFPYVAGVGLGKNNWLSSEGAMPGHDPEVFILRVGEDWMPLGFSSNAQVEKAPVAFAGFGITAADQNYDDYADADVKDKVALALAGTPDGDNPHGRFQRAGGVRFKAAAARAAGARALLVVAGEEKFKEDRLSQLAYDNAGGDAGLPVAVVSRQAAARLLGFKDSAHFAEFEKKVRESKSQPRPAAAQVVPYGIDLKGAAPPALSVSTDIVRREAPAYNVVGVLLGRDPQAGREVVVVGAHYDHLGRGGRDSLAAREGDVHHGADDNASGTAALLELARLLAAEPESRRRTIVFIAFGGEEEGLLGSNFYVNHPAVPLDQTVAMINMDMVGRLREGRLMIGGVGTASEWRGWVERANTGLEVAANAAAPPPQGNGGMPVGVATAGRDVATAKEATRLTLVLSEDGFGPSDHSSFYAKRVPVLFFFTGSHEDYHKPSDTADRINYDGLTRVVGFVREVVRSLQASPQRPTFALAKTEGAARSTGFRVYLGTIPNYGEATDGLLLDGVREGSPAEKAGLKAGDRIVKLAGRDVRNVYDYTQALSGMKAGQDYEVEVVRAGQRQTLKVTPTARK